MTVLAIVLILLACLMLYGVYRTLLLELQYRKLKQQLDKADSLWENYFPTDVNPPLDKEYPHEHA